VGDLRRALRNDRGFHDAAHDLHHRTGRRREERLDELRSGICGEPLEQFQDEHLNMMGQRLAWYVQALDDLNQLEHPQLRELSIRIRYSIGGVIRGRSMPVDILEEEPTRARHRSSAVAGSGGVAPLRYWQYPKSEWRCPTFTQYHRTHHE
jgi:hypothetical protein